jgi:hypothetical protein
MPFVKLDCGILDSSLWPDLYQREVFITALLMAHPIELRERRQQTARRDSEAHWVLGAAWMVRHGGRRQALASCAVPESRTPRRAWLR